MSRPMPRDIKVSADAGGVPVDAEAASRVANAMAPIFEGFEPVSGTLPLDLEPASFLLIQNRKASS